MSLAVVPSVVEVNRHTFLADGLSANAVVIDLGVNRGDFSRALSSLFGCHIIGVEPVADLYRALPELPGVVVEQLAVTADGQPVLLHLNRDSCATVDARLAEPGATAVEVPAVTLGELLDRHGVDRVALAKLDIEGAELEVLQTLDAAVLNRFDQLTVEFHDFLDPGQADAVAIVVRRLRDHGFACLRFSRDNTDVLFVNRSRLPFGLRQRLLVAARYKYPRGIARRVRRLWRRLR